MTTLIDDRRVHAALRHPRDTSISTCAGLHGGGLPRLRADLLAAAGVGIVRIDARGALSTACCFFAWTLYFAFQTWLAASGRTPGTGRSAVIGVSLATAMTIFGFLGGRQRDETFGGDRDKPMRELPSRSSRSAEFCSLPWSLRWASPIREGPKSTSG